MELPQYRCHKVVRAAKITGRLGNEQNGYDITGDGHTVVAHVAANWIDKHNPSIGGYYVLYEDGYASYSPAKAFEEGYTKIQNVDDCQFVTGMTLGVPGQTPAQIDKDTLLAAARAYVHRGLTQSGPVSPEKMHAALTALTVLQ